MGPGQDSASFLGQGGQICPSDFAVSMDGIDAHVDLTSALLGSPASVTVEARVRLDQTGKIHVLVTNARDDFNDGFTLWVNDQDQAVFAVAAFMGRQGFVIGATSLQAGRWYHLAGVYDDAAGVVKVYVDGVEDGSVGFNGGIGYAHGRDFRFGMQVKSYKQVGRFLLGAIDDVRVWSSARAPEDIEASAGGEVPEGVPADLIGHWPMSEGEGTATADLSGSGNTGSLMQGASWEEASQGSCVEVSIEVKPALEPPDQPKPINFNEGTTPVAVYSTADLDIAQELDRSSLTFGRTGEEASLHWNGPGEPNCAAADLNGDGFFDLVCHFITDATGFEVGDTEAYLRGMTLAGLQVGGRDEVRVIK